MMNASISLYESILQLSSQMVAAAEKNDWDLLCALEGEVTGLRERLQREDPPAHQASLDEATRQRKAGLIRQILADDRNIRSHTQPWMDSVKTLLTGNARQRSVQQAYGAGL
jgi:flagellar protein FliT